LLQFGEILGDHRFVTAPNPLAGSGDFSYVIEQFIMVGAEPRCTQNWPCDGWPHQAVARRWLAGARNRDAGSLCWADAGIGSPELQQIHSAVALAAVKPLYCSYVLGSNCSKGVLL
jgi:hypothetical protein